MLTLYRPDMAKVLAGLDSPAFRYAQVYEHLFRRPVRPFSEATTLPADIRVPLDALRDSTLTQVEERSSPDGTTKLLLSGRDGACLETVLMRYRDRVTVCISSQVGCPVRCAFCATGGLGFGRNLSAAEIVDQVRAASALAGSENRRVSNVVYMGMGEPLLNLQAVLDSIRILTDPNGGALAHRAISVSTVGIPSGILRLGQLEPQVNLAISLHAPDDETRALLIPKRFCHPLTEILDAAWDHFALTHRKMLVEYVLLRGINDSVEHARVLARLLRGHVVAVNLLRWNPVSRSLLGKRKTEPPSGEPAAVAGAARPVFQPSLPADVAAFRETLLSSHIETVVRQSKGSTIQGACGQLAGRRQGASGADQAADEETSDDRSAAGKPPQPPRPARRPASQSPAGPADTRENDVVPREKRAAIPKPHPQVSTRTTGPLRRRAGTSPAVPASSRDGGTDREASGQQDQTQTRTKPKAPGRHD